ncbi:hypothetical protein CL6EHI_142220 [Entamoeba histolytica]|nr:hypothetical protein CL6EHI_142220 [Entamoeba histolytica]
MSRKSATIPPVTPLVTALEIVEDFNKMKKDGLFPEQFSIDVLSNSVLPILNNVYQRIIALTPLCYTTDEILSPNHRGRWIILTEKAIKYLSQSILAFCKEFYSNGTKSGLNIALYRLNYVMYLFSIEEPFAKITLNQIKIPENDPENQFNFKKYDKTIECLSKAVAHCLTKDKKKIFKATEFFKKIETDVFTRIPKKKTDKKPLSVTNSYIKELFNFRGLLKAQLDMAYRDNSNEEQGVNYQNVLIEGYAITFPFKNKKMIAADVMSEFLFALFDCQTDERYKSYPKDPCEIEQTIMNLIFFWYVNYNEDFHTPYCDTILKFMNTYCSLVFDSECINVAVADRKIEMQKKGVQIKVQSKKIRLCYINENIVADIMTELDAHLYFLIPISIYLGNLTSDISSETKGIDSKYVRFTHDIASRADKYSAFVKRMIGIDINDSYQFFISLCTSLVYRCHNYFASYIIFSTLQKVLDEINTRKERGFNLNSLEKNVIEQYNDLKSIFPNTSNPGNLENYQITTKLAQPFICHPDILKSVGNKLMSNATKLSLKNEVSPEIANELNTFVKNYEESEIYYLQKPKVRAESLRPVLGFDLLEYLSKLPIDESEEKTLAHFDRPTKIVIKRTTKEDRIKRRKALAKKRMSRRKEKAQQSN